MKLNILVSTMDQVDYKLINSMNIKTDAVFVNQGADTFSKMIFDNDNSIKWINSTDKGLSKSRNLAINNAEGEICLLSDDDMVYEDNTHLLIIDEFKKNPEADIIAFQVKKEGKNYKNYFPRKRKLNYLTSMKVSSVEIAFKLEAINNNNLNFKEEFGAGSVFTMGEENIFLTEALKKKMNIYYVPLNLGHLKEGESSWFCGYNEKFFHDRGASYAAMSRIFSFPLIIQFAIRKKNQYKTEMTLFSALKNMFIGRNHYLKSKRNFVK